MKKILLIFMVAVMGLGSFQMAFGEDTSSNHGFEAGKSYKLTNKNSNWLAVINTGGPWVDQWGDWPDAVCRWYLEPDQSNPAYLRIVTRAGYLEDTCIASATDEGAFVNLEKITEGADSQLWEVELKDGSVSFKNKINGKYLSVKDKSKEYGARLITTHELSDAALWTVTEEPYEDEPAPDPIKPPTGTEKIPVVSAKLITDDFVEIVFDREVENTKRAETYELKINGQQITDFGILPYFDGVVTIYLTKAVEDPKNAEITVSFPKENIRDKDDNSLDKDKIHTVKYDPYYTKEYIAKTGVKVKAGSSVKDSSLEAAAKMIDVMLGKRPDIAKKMADLNSYLAIIPYGQHAFYIPEHRFAYSLQTLYAEGFGGTTEVPTTTCTESNIERNLDVTTYKNENIVVHEFGHAIHLIGIKNADKELYEKIAKTYTDAKTAGLWPNTYGISNEMEYFATTTAVWFDLMDESNDGSFDGVRGPVSTSEELKIYDRAAYDLLSEIYDEDVYFDAPWQPGSIPNNFDISGKRLQNKPLVEYTVFYDIKDHWAKEYIESAVSLGLFNKTQDRKFSPDMPVNRAMFVTILGKIEGADIKNYTQTVFSDVKNDSYYAGYVQWAVENGIIKGINNTTFAPEETITREQMSVIIIEYAKLKGLNHSVSNEENTFADSEKISSWAKESVKLMQISGVVEGGDNNKFEPGKTLTRAEAATVFVRFMEIFNVK